MIELGDTVKDMVSGYEGVVLAKMTALYEMTKYRVHTAKLKDAGTREFMWFEEGRLVVIKPLLKPEESEEKPTSQN
jgi:hypothetical protein